MELLEKVLKSIEETKLSDLKVYETKDITPFFDYGVVVTASNSRQLVAAVNKLKKDLSAEGFDVKGIEGLDGGLWVLIDLNAVIVNVFLEEEREKYDLDKLWRTLPQANKE